MAGVQMTVFRILEATARPGRAEEVAELLVAQAGRVGANHPGVVFAQALRSGDSVLGVSCWRDTADVERYLESETTQAFYRELPRLLMGVPTVRTYEVLKTVTGDQAAGSDTGAWPRR